MNKYLSLSAATLALALSGTTFACDNNVDDNANGYIVEHFQLTANDTTDDTDASLETIEIETMLMAMTDDTDADTTPDNDLTQLMGEDSDVDGDLESLVSLIATDVDTDTQDEPQFI